MFVCLPAGLSSAPQPRSGLAARRCGQFLMYQPKVVVGINGNWGSLPARERRRWRWPVDLRAAVRADVCLQPVAWENGVDVPRRPGLHVFQSTFIAEHSGAALEAI